MCIAYRITMLEPFVTDYHFFDPTLLSYLNIQDYLKTECNYCRVVIISAASEDTPNLASKSSWSTWAS